MKRVLLALLAAVLGVLGLPMAQAGAEPAGYLHRQDQQIVDGSGNAVRLRGVNLVGADVVEVSPPYDSPGAVTALAAATVAYELLSLRALRS